MAEFKSSILGLKAREKQQEALVLETRRKNEKSKVEG